MQNTTETRRSFGVRAAQVHARNLGIDPRDMLTGFEQAAGDLRSAGSAQQQADLADLPPLREIPALIRHLWAQIEKSDDEIDRLAGRLQIVLALRAAVMEKECDGPKTMTGLGAELAGMVSLVDRQNARLRAIVAAVEL